MTRFNPAHKLGMRPDPSEWDDLTALDVLNRAGK